MLENLSAHKSEARQSESGNTGFLKMSLDSLQGMTGDDANKHMLDEKNRPLTRWERKKKRMFGEAGTMTRLFA